MDSVIQSQGLGVDERVGMPALQNATSSVVDIYTQSKGTVGVWPPQLSVKTYLGISSGMDPLVQLAFMVIKMLFSILRSQTTRRVL